MRVLMLTTNSSLMDGINRHILSIAPSLNGFPDIEVSVCTVQPYGDLNKALEAQNVKSFSLNSPNGHDLKIFSRLHKVLRDFKPDIIHQHVMAINERILLSTFFQRLKYVNTVHGLIDNVSQVSLKTKLERLLGRLFKIKYSAICYISNGVMQQRSQWFERNNPNAIEEVIYNPIKTNAPHSGQISLHKILNVPTDTLLIGTSCRIAKVKNPEIFTETMCKVLQMQDNIHAVVFGDGDSALISKCKSIVENFNLENRFHWLGFRADAPELVKDLNCFVMTSTSEGMPTSLLECMVNHTPFAFLQGKGGLVDIERMNQKYGPFCVIGNIADTEAFSHAILHLVNSGEISKNYVNNAYEIASDYFNVIKISAKLADIYRSCLKAKPGLTHETKH